MADVRTLAERHELAPAEEVLMPANNFILTFQRAG
jgi:hypothetical protein